jgi:DHA1 family tetracycline resistance protein-like MFS transporter
MELRRAKQPDPMTEAQVEIGTAGPVPAARTGSIPFVLVTIVLDTLGIGLLIPVGPRLVQSLVGGGVADEIKWFGYLMLLYSAMQFVFAPVLGGLSDRFGRRPVIFGSLLGAVFSYLASGFAPALSWLFVGRAVAGATAASFSAAGAYIADVTPPEKRAQAFGMIGAAFGLGFILGPALGGQLGSYGLRVPYFAAAGLNFVNLLYGIFVLPESLAPQNRRPFSLKRANPFGAVAALVREPFVRGLTLTMFCSFLAQMILQNVWALHTQARFGWSMREVGMSLMAVGLATSIVQGVLVRQVVARLGERRALVLGLCASALGFACFGLADTGWLMYVFIVPFVLGGMAGPATQALISRHVAANRQGEIQGAVMSLQGLTAVFAPYLGTSLLARFGTEGARPYIPGAAFFASCLLVLMGLAFALRLFARQAKLS